MVERKLIPVAPPETDSLCGSCIGACCLKGTMMELTDDERDFFEEGGADIVDSGIPTRSQEEATLRQQLGDEIFDSLAGVVSDATENPQYILLKDCPYLVKTTGTMAICSVYEDPRRPGICARFTTGGTNCLAIREKKLPTPGTI